MDILMLQLFITVNCLSQWKWVWKEKMTAVHYPLTLKVGFSLKLKCVHEQTSLHWAFIHNTLIYPLTPMSVYSSANMRWYLLCEGNKSLALVRMKSLRMALMDS